MPARESLQFDILARDVNTRRTLEEVADSADDAGTSLDGLAKKADGLDASTTDLDKSSTRLTQTLRTQTDVMHAQPPHINRIDAEIRRLQASVRALIEEFDQTGDIELLKSVRKDRSELALFESMRKQLAELPGEAAKAGSAAGKAFGGGFAAMPLPVKGALLAAAAAMAPQIGATISAGIVTGVGAGVLGAGLAGAFHDPRVQAEAQAFGGRLKAMWLTATEPLAQPLVDGMDTIEAASARAAGRMQSVFAGLGPEVRELATGIAGLTDNALPGLERGTQIGQRGLRALARELPDLGDSVTYFFEQLDDDGSITALASGLDMLQGTIKTTGDVIGGLTAAYQNLVEFSADVTGRVEDIWGWLPWVGDQARRANDMYEGWLDTTEASKTPTEEAARANRELANQLRNAADAAKEAHDALYALVDGELDVRESVRRFRDALAGMKDELVAGNRSLNENTAAGRQNAQVVDDLIRMAIQAGKAEEQRMLALKATKVEAEAAGASLRESLIKSLLDNAEKLHLNRQRLLEFVASLQAADGTTIRIYVDQVLREKSLDTTMRGRTSGGKMIAYSEGGPVRGPGTDTSDDMFARVSNGEWIVRARAARAIGPEGMAAINNADRGGMQAMRLPTGVTSGGQTQDGGWDLVAALEAAVSRALSGATLVLDDRQGQRAYLMTRAG